jgi:hypothetical protein
MAAPRNVVTGFNHNVKHKGKVYHVQTEDSGPDIGHIITHVFVGGNILASKKTSYAELRGAENLRDRVRELMEQQHKEILRNLIGAQYDDIEAVHSAAVRAFQPGQLAVGGEQVQHDIRLPGAGPAAPAPAVVPKTLPPEVIAARELTEAPRPPPETGDTIFGEDLISEKSLDEVILSYLAGDGEDSK